MHDHVEQVNEQDHPLLIVAGDWSALLVRFIANPVIFLSLFGPLIVGFAMSHIIGEVAYDATQGNPRPVLGFFSHAAFPGSFDYTVQYYTALLVFAFWAAQTYTAVVVPLATNKATHPARAKLYMPFAFLVFLFSSYVLFLGGAARFDVIEMYLEHTTKLGDPSLPPLSSPITQIRILIGILGTALYLVDGSVKLSSIWRTLQSMLRRVTNSTTVAEGRTQYDRDDEL